MARKIVWEFTNKRKLTAFEFIRYFENKIKKTIRKYQMPINQIQDKNKDKSEKTDLREKILNKITEKLIKRKGKISLENLDDISCKIIYIMMYDDEKKLKKLLPKNQPFYFLSNKEILLYAKLKKIKGTLKTGNKKSSSGKNRKLEEIHNFIKKFEQKNPDIRQNIIQALLNSKI